MSSILALASAAAVLCSNPSVHDGDSLRCGTERIRISNIDAPELAGSPKCEARRRSRSAWCDDAAGEAARRALAGLLAGRRVTIVRIGTDAYGRTLARVYAGDIDVGEWLIERGLARRWR
jgi:micrococcal nuclease